MIHQFLFILRQYIEDLKGKGTELSGNPQFSTFFNGVYRTYGKVIIEEDYQDGGILRELLQCNNWCRFLKFVKKSLTFPLTALLVAFKNRSIVIHRVGSRYWSGLT